MYIYINMGLAIPTHNQFMLLSPRSVSKICCFVPQNHFSNLTAHRPNCTSCLPGCASHRSKNLALLLYTSKDYLHSPPQLPTIPHRPTGPQAHRPNCTSCLPGCTSHRSNHLALLLYTSKDYLHSPPQLPTGPQAHRPNCTSCLPGCTSHRSNHPTLLLSTFRD